MPEREFESVRLETDISFWDSGAAMIRPAGSCATMAGRPVPLSAWRVGLSIVMVGLEGDKDGRILGLGRTRGSAPTWDRRFSRAVFSDLT